MRGKAIADDAAAEDNGAKLAAALLLRHGLSIKQLYKHQDWSGKACPLYILPHWADFRAKVEAYLKRFGGTAAPAPEPAAQGTAIAGAAVATEYQMRAYLEAKNPAAYAQDYSGFPAIYLAEGKKEGIRGDVAFAQSLLETGFFKFGGDVKPEQNNFCGLGATGGGAAGNSFDTPDLGIRAQVQHLKAYANAEPLNGECVDPRFKWVSRGAAPYVEWLGIPDNPNGKGWAAGANYGASILKILADVLEMPEALEAPPAPAAEYDNTPADWEKAAVEKAKSRGVIKPDAAGDLRLHSTVTRAEVLVMLERAGIL